MSLRSRISKALRVNAITKRDRERGFVDIAIDHYGGGFFAQLNWCLHIFEFAKKHSLKVNLSLMSDNYRVAGDAEDWLPRYFSLKDRNTGRVDKGKYRKRIQDIGELRLPETRDLTLAEANKIFFEFMDINPDIQAEVDSFCQKNFSGKRMVGLHYRGTDKSSEAQRISYNNAIAAVARSLNDDGYDAVFVSTDEDAFLQSIAKSLPDARILSRDDSARSTDGTAVHLNSLANKGKDLGRDALVNSLILSRCGKLIKTSSFLSAWSVIFNPAIDVELLSVAYGNRLWYPEREIIRSKNINAEVR